MQSLLTPRFILTFIFIGVVSAAISALLFSPQVGFLNWITGFFTAMTPLRFFGLTVAILAAAGISYAAARIGTDPHRARIGAGRQRLYLREKAFD